jgi:hypothetical protein
VRLTGVVNICSAVKLILFKTNASLAYALRSDLAYLRQVQYILRIGSTRDRRYIEICTETFELLRTCGLASLCDLAENYSPLLHMLVGSPLVLY